jgi:protein-disulfide isomerase
MKTETKVLAGILLFTLLLLGGGIYFLSKSAAKQEAQNNQVVDIDYSKGQKIGSDSAKVKLVEFGDFQCPACGGAEPTVEEILAKNDPNLQFIFRHFPLPQHQNARPAANAAEEAAAEGKFWEMHHRLYASQDQWAENNTAADYFANLAQEVGVDQTKVKSAVESKQYEAKINDDLAEGTRVGVNSTPTFYINGKRINLTSFAQLKDEVQKALDTP